MTLNSVMGFVSTLALLLPMLLILALRLSFYRSFPFLLIYFSMAFINNLMTEGYIQTTPDVAYYWGISINLLDVPLMLMFLSYFSTSVLFSRRLKILILSFIAFELLVVLLVGFNVKSITIILGPGILLIFVLCFFFFIRQSKIVITNQKAVGKTLMVASLVFAYGCYGILYVLFYIIKTPLVADAFLIYFIVVTISSISFSIGLLYERKRILKLFELIKARKELHDLYKDAKASAPFRTAMLDFDREPWN